MRIASFPRISGAWAAIVAASLCASRAEAQSAPSLDGLSIHGFLSQAYAAADGGQVRGIPTGGTTDYRTAALQVRFDATDRTRVVVQLSHERMGRNPVVAEAPDLALDWAFIEQQLGSGVYGRAGRAKLPTGIYSEIQDVGTLIPLHRAPYVLYSDQFLSTESVNGIVAGRRGSGEAWSLDAHVYAGGWNFRNSDYSRSRARNGLGAQLWLTTPLSGVRLGVGGRRFDVDRYADDPNSHVQDWTQWQLGLDATFDRWFLRSEYQHVDWESDAGSFGWFEAFYGQIGASPIRRLTLVAEAQKANVRYAALQPIAFDLTREADRDLALGARWAFTPALVAKAEWHWYRGYAGEDTGFDPATAFVLGERTDARFAVLGLSASF
jgi:hypothetical protein